MAQLAEATFNRTLHVVVACDTNPIAFGCSLYGRQLEPPSRLKDV